MKRTNVIVDEELLEEARRVTGEKTYSGAINTALEEYVRRNEYRALLREMQARAGEHFFWPGYLEQIRPNAYSTVKRERAAAHEKRAPRATRRARGSR